MPRSSPRPIGQASRWCSQGLASSDTSQAGETMTDRHPTSPIAESPPYSIAAGVAVCARALSVLTLAPTTQFWAASEYITAAHALGIPHPPGNPLFVILAHAWGLLPLGADYARRINLFGAATSAAAAGCWFLIAERWLHAIVPPRWARQLAAAARTLVRATPFSVWDPSAVSEKGYTPTLLSI